MMKIFILLFGYLAVAPYFDHTASASPTALVAGRKGDIMQQRIDALMKRDFKQTMETRQSVDLPTANIITLLLSEIFDDLKNWAEGDVGGNGVDDNGILEYFTQYAVSNCSNFWPKYNWIIDDDYLMYVILGVQGLDWNITQFTIDLQNFQKPYTYKIFYLKTGNYTRHQDGGYLHWATVGHFSQTFDKGLRVLHFTIPPS